MTLELIARYYLGRQLPFIHNDLKCPQPRTVLFRLYHSYQAWESYRGSLEEKQQYKDVVEMLTSESIGHVGAEVSRRSSQRDVRE